MKTVLITGAAKGIGAAMATKFAKEGYQVIIHYYKSEKEAKVLKENLETKYEKKVMLVKADLKNEKEIKKMFEQINKEFSTIDVLINNAAMNFDQPLDEKTKDIFDKVITTNLTGTFLVSKYSVKIMEKNQKGVIINIASTNGLDSYYPMSIDYDASKAGIISLTHNFALNYKPWLRVNAIAPGWIETENTKDMNPAWKEQEKSKIFQNRFGYPEEVASLAYFLASDEATYINNSVIRIDGGSQNN